MIERRPILSKAEKYSQPAKRVNKRLTNKKHPYDFPNTKKRLLPKLNSALSELAKLPLEAKPDNKIVTKITLHPSYLAKSFFPVNLFSRYNLVNLGSKEVFISPEVTIADRKTEEVSTSQYFVAGRESDIRELVKDIENSTLEESLKDDLIKLEDFDILSRKDRISKSVYLENNSQNDNTLKKYEVVLHASNSDDDILSSFMEYVKNLQGETFPEKNRTIKGLTFCFILLKYDEIPNLADFSYIRVVRPVPELKVSESFSELLEERKPIAVEGLNDKNHIKSHSNIAVFDAGLFAEDCEKKEIRYFDLTGRPSNDSDYHEHGSLVTSAIVYGEAQNYIDKNNVILNVDHYKVISKHDKLDIALVDVLDRIVNVLATKKYKFANISIGPEFPCPDDEPSLWTAMLDDVAADGDILIVVAVGNKGEYFDTQDNDLARIQPPADILNGLSIGAATGKENGWERARYSCVGPGRRPGFVKPDALYFGGDPKRKLDLISMSNYEIRSIYGTSYAAPLVTRQAALIDIATRGALDVATIRALLIHSTEDIKSKRIECGWGLINSNIEDILYCTDSKVTFIYQGRLDSASGVRAAVPFPSELRALNGKIELNATLCFYTDVDQQHTVSYTRAGVEVTFRPNLEKKTGQSKQPSTRSLFTKKKILGDEHNLRTDAHKWETCYKVSDKMLASSLLDPVFDIKYLTRDEGHSRSAAEMRKLPPLHYSLIVTIYHDKGYNIYESIRNHYTALVPLDINIDVAIQV